MISFACKKCDHTIRTVGVGADDLLGRSSQWWPDKFPCPVCGEYTSAGTNAIGTVIDLEAEEAFAAFHGLGLPNERDCGEEAVKQAFSASPIRKIHTKTVNRKRCCVDHIALKDGTKVFFGSSAYGAVVYRISKPHSYTAVALEEAENGRA